jgi:dihydroflavonol-4-reductase
LEEAFENVSEVYHCAAHVSFQRSGFTHMMKINREGTANIVNIALEKENIRLVYVSSTAAVCKDSENPTKPVVENNKWVQDTHTSKYSITKYSAEKEVWRGVEEGLNAVILNPSMILGAGNWDESSLTIFRTLDKGLKFYTNGGNAFVDARDIAEIMLILMKSTIQKERFLVTGTNILFKDFFEKVCAQMHKKSPSIRVNSFMTGIIWRLSHLLSFVGIKPAITKETARSAQEITRYDSTKFTSLFNFQFRPIEDTIQNTIQGRLK